MSTRGGKTRPISTLISPDPDMTEDRVGALEMIEKFNKNPHFATKEDIRWFWKDMDMDSHESYMLAKTEVAREEKFIKWNNQYPFELTEWVMEWYSYMPDAISFRLNGAGQIDWNLIFTLIEPLNTEGIPFICLVKALNVRQNQMARQQIYRTIAEDPILRQKVLNHEPISPIYTHYTPYSKIHREVVKILNPPKERSPQGSSRVFKLVEKAMREESIPFEEALKRI